MIANICYWKHARQAHFFSRSSGRGCTCWCASCRNQSWSSAPMSPLIKDIMILWWTAPWSAPWTSLYTTIWPSLTKSVLSVFISHILEAFKFRIFGLVEALRACLISTNERTDNIKSSRPIRRQKTLHSTLLIQSSQHWGPLMVTWRMQSIQFSHLVHFKRFRITFVI